MAIIKFCDKCGCIVHGVNRGGDSVVTTYTEGVKGAEGKSRTTRLYLCDSCRVVFYEAAADFHAVLLEAKEEARRKIMKMCGKTDAEEHAVV